MPLARVPVMDATPTSRPDHASARTFDEKLSEKIPIGIGSPKAYTNHLSIDTHPAALRHGPSDSPATAARTPDRQTIEEIARSQHFTIRTLPGTFSVPLAAVVSTVLTNAFHSLDPISRGTL